MFHKRYDDLFCYIRNCQQLDNLEDGVKGIIALSPVVYTGSCFKLGDYLGDMHSFYRET